MAELNHNIDPNDLMQERPAVPAGDYPIIIEKSDVVATKTGGEGVPLQCQIIDGPYKGYKLFHFITIIKEDGSINQAGKRTLNSIGTAVGLSGTIKYTEQVHDIPLMAKVNFISEKEDPQYGPKNEVKKFYAIKNAQTNPQQPQNTGSPVQDAGGTKKPAWQKE